MLDKFLRFWPIFVICAALYVIAVIIGGLGWNPSGANWNFQNSAEFGDSLAPLGTAIALVAAIGAVAAYRAQKDELDRVKKAAPIERAEAAKRDFEITFFNLLSLLRETVKEVDVSDSYNQNPVYGRDAFKRLLEEYVGGSGGSDESDSAKFRKVYFAFRDDLAHYFRLIYHILKFISAGNVPDKMFYVRLLRATLSNAEIVLIALNCMYGGGQKKLRPLVEEFALLHNISTGDAKIRRIITGFDRKAFGDRRFDENEDDFSTSI